MVLPLAVHGAARADWPLSPYQCVSLGPVAGHVASYGVDLPIPIAVDGRGGLIAAWPRAPELFAQRVDSVGTLDWGTDVLIPGAPGAQLYPVVVSDDSRGAFVVWEDWRDTTGPDIYAQHVDAGGSLLWNPTGVPICTADQTQIYLVACPDQQGGLLVAWQDYRGQPASSRGVYAQRLTSEGIALWGLDGRAVATGLSSYQTPRLLASGDGGAYIAWTASNVGAEEVWIQRLDGNGNPAWASPTRVGSGFALSLLSDRRGGAFVGVTASRLQRVSAAGMLLLGSEGVALPIGVGYALAGIEDESGGSYWLFRTPDGVHIIARVDSSGTAIWPQPVVLGVGSDGSKAVLVRDGLGGVIASWIDDRSGAPQVFAMRLDSHGRELWAPGGLAVHVRAGEKYLVGGVTDGAHGLIVVWDDHDAKEIRAQRVDAAGSILPFVASGPRAITLAPSIPNPSKAGVVIRFRLEEGARTRVSVLDVAGRLVRRVFDGDLDAGAHQCYWSGYRADYRRVANGVYIILIEALGQRAMTRVVLLGGPRYLPGRPQ